MKSRSLLGLPQKACNHKLLSSSPTLLAAIECSFIISTDGKLFLSLTVVLVFSLCGSMDSTLFLFHQLIFTRDCVLVVSTEGRLFLYLIAVVVFSLALRTDFNLFLFHQAAMVVYLVFTMGSYEYHISTI